MLVQEEFYQNDEASVLDELVGFLLAGMFTIQVSTCNLLVNIERNPACKEKLRAEVIPAVEAAADDIVNKLEYETVMDFDYLHWVYYETLRMLPPTTISAT